MYMNTTYSTKQSAVAMRKRMSDDTNKYNFNRKRILDRIREGSIPQQNFIVFLLSFVRSIARLSRSVTVCVSAIRKNARAQSFLNRTLTT